MMTGTVTVKCISTSRVVYIRYAYPNIGRVSSKVFEQAY
jgi:hypothetical protein